MWRTCLAVLAAALSLSLGSAAFAVDAILDSTLETGGAAIRVAKPGDTFFIVGDCLAMARSARDVRVVLSLAEKGDSGMGYTAVLATEQELSDESLQVRVPEMPRMSNHLFRVRVFALDGEPSGACEAGQIRIG